MALHVAALRHSRSDIGTKPVVGHSDQGQSEVWVSTSEAAAELNVTDRCIRKWIHAKRLPATMSGARWLINRSDVDVFKLTT
jgi:excisionase family DNA binding protein